MPRFLLLFIILLACLGACGLVREDLGRARARFKTELIKKLPAPQDYVYSFPPEGVRVIYYKSGNLRLKAWMSEKSTGEQKLPAIVFAHGGFSFGRSDWEEARPFIEAGFILLAPMLRGGNGNPGYFEFFYGEVDDLLAAGAYLSHLRRIDSNRLFLVGYDTGGTLALLCSQIKNPFHTIIAIGPAPDQDLYFKSYWQSSIPFDTRNELEFRLRSPLAYVFSIKTPLFILVGDMDLNCKSQSLQFARLAAIEQKPCETEVLIGDHFSVLKQAVIRSLELCRSRL
jgi:dipeptidyl aminopeptidase/acylaminoacyl peptidase